MHFICSVVHQKGVQLVTDTVSYELLKGAVVDYTTDLIRASFEVCVPAQGADELLLPLNLSWPLRRFFICF